MTKRSLLGIVLTLSLFAINSFAQSMVWSLPPSDYSNIQQIGHQIFRVTDANGKLLIIKSDGSLTVPCDEVTPFYNHWALLISNEGNEKRVVGCISIDGNCNAFNNVYYAMPGQMFFSEGLLTVENKSKRKVYIDVTGQEVIGGDKKYYDIKPFSEGYAVVFKNENTKFLIDKSGKNVSIKLPRNGITLIGATSVYHDEALVWDKNGNFFIYNAKNRTATETTKPTENVKPDYLYRMSQEGTTPPYSTYKGQESEEIIPYANGSKYGYAVNGDKTIIPYSFSYAGPVIDGYAVVQMPDGKSGIMKYEQNSSGEFKIQPIQQSIQFSPRETVSCEFRVTPPNAWQGQEFTLMVDNQEANPTMVNGVYAFDYRPSASQNQKFTVKVYSHGILLQTSTINYSFKQKEAPAKCKTCGKEIDKCQYNGNHPVVKKCQTGGKESDKCQYGGNHPKVKKCKTCGKEIDKCQYGGNHPKVKKCKTCGKEIDKCQYGGDHPKVKKCKTCGKEIDKCQYKGNHPKCKTCGKEIDKCQYKGNHPVVKKCQTCGKEIDKCKYKGNHPKCKTCGKEIDKCQYKGNHPGKRL